jgi:hypothetical protein
MPKGYMNTAAAAQRTPAHLGSVPERQTATPSSTLPTNSSTITSREVTTNTVSAKMGDSLSYSSMPARYACPSLGAEKVETPIAGRNRAVPKTVTTMATNPSRPAWLLAR